MADYVIGDALTELRKLPDEWAHCCVTSPPYWRQRDYGVAGQLGQEETPELYVEALMGVLREVRRVLRSDGTLWLNLGDTYIGSRCGGQGPGGCLADRAVSKARANVTPTKSAPGLKRKDLVGIPWRVAFALQADGWWLRSDVIWDKPTPMPEAVSDRPTKAHEYLFLLARSEQYYYDSAAIRERSTSTRPAGNTYQRPERGNDRGRAERWELTDWRQKRSVWRVQSMPYPGAHYATFPPKLIEPCIMAGCPLGGIVLDPFFGSGTTGHVAEALGRRWFGIELNPKDESLIRERTNQLGLFARAT